MTDDADERIPCVVIIEGRSKGRVVVLDRVRSYVVGRLSGAEIHIEDPGVSRRHVKLTRREDGSVEASDMRSTNGLIINGERIERGPLLEGDEISLGPDAVLRLDYRTLDEIERPQTLGARTPAFASLHADEEQTATILRAKLDELPLSARQLEVSQHVANGLTNAAIAERLGISPRTVTSHLDHIYGRLGISSRAALTRWIVERGLTKPN